MVGGRYPAEGEDGKKTASSLPVPEAATGVVPDENGDGDGGRAAAEVRGDRGGGGVRGGVGSRSGAPADGILFGVGFLGAGLRSVVFFAVVLADAADFVAAFLVAVFQPVPHTMHDRSVRALFVSHFAQRQSAVGRAAPGRLAAGREAPDAPEPPAGLAAGLDVVEVARGAAPRRLPPHVPQDVSAGAL
ncbi:hypothetical protein [Streptomyces sp. NPDC052036]|uniref:hypothetical protein n=1 Tax=Streptomyces sp. NPDC052036 TaxID=3155171 RepID=UPI00343CD44E